MDEGFPVFLAAFDRPAMERHSGVIVALDTAFRIVWTNPAWARFAQEEGSPHVAERFGPGVCYLDGISGPLRSFYDGVLRASLADQTPFEQDYDCPTGTLHRRYHLRALPIDGDGVLVEHSMIVQRPHTPADGRPEPVAYQNEAGMYNQCSNCRRMRRVDGVSWDWVPDWVTSPPEATSHGICPQCLGYYWQPAKDGGPAGGRAI